MNKKWILTGLGGLLGGVIINASWEYVFRDVLNAIFKLLLTISTLGIESYRDGIYSSVAKGFIERPSFELLNFFVAILVSFIVLMTIRVWKPPSREEGSSIKNWVLSHQKAFRIFVFGYSVFMVVLLTLDLARIAYINKSIAYYNQLAKIAAPLISQEQQEIFDSEFAQIKNRANYVKLTSQLQDAIRPSNQELPPPPSFIF